MEFIDFVAASSPLVVRLENLGTGTSVFGSAIISAAAAICGAAVAATMSYVVLRNQIRTQEKLTQAKFQIDQINFLYTNIQLPLKTILETQPKERNGSQLATAIAALKILFPASDKTAAAIRLALDRPLIDTEMDFVNWQRDLIREISLYFDSITSWAHYEQRL